MFRKWGIILGVLPLILLISTVSFSKGRPHKTSLSTFKVYHDKYAVLIAASSNGVMKDFCSGTITNIGIVTAAHCCAVPFQNKINLFYSVDGETYKSTKSWETDQQGQDLCVLTPLFPEPSPVRVADLPHIAGSQWQNTRNYMNISKISLMYGGVDLIDYEIQNVYRLGVFEEDTSTTLFAGYGCPGMSGSGIFDMKGNLVGVLMLGIFKDNPDRNDFIPGIFGAALIEQSQWAPNQSPQY